MPLLFSFQGRIGRGEFWLLMAAASTLCCAAQWLTRLPLPPTAIAALQGTVTIGCAWVALAAAVKRLHDTEHSGWWQLWDTLTLGACFCGGALMATVLVAPYLPETHPLIINASLEHRNLLLFALYLFTEPESAACLSPFIAMTLWNLQVYGFAQGTVGVNKYGRENSGSWRS